MNILLVVHDYLPDHIGGTEVHTHQLARALQEVGHEVRVATTERRLDFEEGQWIEREHEGVPVSELVHTREYSHAFESLRSPFAAKAFAARLPEWNPDVVHFQHLAHFGAECVEVARDFGAAVVCTLHDYYLLCQHSTLRKSSGELCSDATRARCADCVQGLPFPELASESPRRTELEQLDYVHSRERLHRHFLRSAQAVIAPSRFLVERFSAAGFVENGRWFQLKAGYPGVVHPPRPAPVGTLRVGYVGGIYPAKGVHVAIEAFAMLRDANLRLELHGVLEWFPDYVTELRELAEGSAVEFVGRFDPRDVDRVLSGLDLLVVPSLWYENMPLTIHEAFRCGVPILVSDLGGMREAVDPGRGGERFPAGDARALAERLRELEGDRERLAELAAARPVIPTVDEVRARIEQVYEACLAERRGEPGPSSQSRLDDLRPQGLFPSSS